MSDDVTDNTFDDLVLTEVNCCNCTVRFAVTKTFEDRRRKDSRTFYCPNGHAQHYPPVEKPRDELVEDLEEQVEALHGELNETKNALASERAHHEQQASLWRIESKKKQRRWSL